MLIKIQMFLSNKMLLKMSPVKWQPLCLSLNMLIKSSYIAAQCDMLCHIEQFHNDIFVVGISGLKQNLSLKAYNISLA